MVDDATIRLGPLLKQTRELRNMSIRRTAERLGISATYLGQLEAGTVKEPSPHILHRFAELFGVSYAELMRAAGYAVPGESIAVEGGSASQHPLDVSLRTASPLTDAEREALGEYLAWYRSRNGRPPERA